MKVWEELVKDLTSSVGISRSYRLSGWRGYWTSSFNAEIFINAKVNNYNISNKLRVGALALKVIIMGI